MLLWAFVGCETVLTGQVRGDDEAPVVGAVLHADGVEADCDAVTGPDGRFRVRCPRGAWSFAVTHPAYLPGAWAVSADASGELDVGGTTLVRVPTEPGVHVRTSSGFVPLPSAPLVRAVDEGREQRLCVSKDHAPLAVPAGRLRLLDNHVADWRVWKVAEDGCAWRLQKGQGDHWSWTAERLEPAATEELAPGRTWVDLDLPAGDYVVAEWYADYFVRDEGPKDTYRAAWLRAQ